jgi:hypothetical protein
MLNFVDFLKRKRRKLVALAVNAAGNWFVYATTVFATAGVYAGGLSVLYGVTFLLYLSIVMLWTTKDAKKDFLLAFFALIDGIFLGLTVNGFVDFFMNNKADGVYDLVIFGFLTVVSFLLNKEDDEVV